MRQEKQLLLDEIKELIDKQGSFLIMSYLGLEANMANKFRRNIADLGGGVEFVRKKLLLKAAQESGVQIDTSLPGHIGLVFAGQDSIATTKAVFKFRKESDQAVKVLGARIDGIIYNAQDVEKISTLPSKPEMQAQLLATFEAPMAQLVGVMNSLLTSTLYCMESKCKQEQEQQVTVE